jgi:peptidoglycan/xylan/chitin deacetylase (PgdA/CDA1 family)
VALGALGVAAGSLLPAAGSSAPIASDSNERTDFAPPLALARGASLRPLWAAERPARVDAPALARLPAGARLSSPWIESTPGVLYLLRTAGTGIVRVGAEWFDATGRGLARVDTPWRAVDDAPAVLATPATASGLRLHLVAGEGGATITGLALTLGRGVRVEPFPDYRRAAFAFSFDWETAMGGLIHSRSPQSSEGAGTQVALRADGAPSVEQAEAKGLRMREGGRVLAELFARRDIRATYYATGYNLLPGNAAGERFLGNPIYPNADRAHGWGSDYWRTHPWYEHDPVRSEETAPAWYFAAVTRELAAAGHELASHSFGHLYVRGVTPEQLRDDLRQWQRSARALGIPVARSFAFPWTSSNSLDGRFWAVFAELGMTVLTRRYPPDLRRPYELDAIEGVPSLVVFPDTYLPSKAAVLEEALARVEETIGRRGYHSLWTHPNEVLEQDGPTVWPRVIEGVAAARARGLWVAPVTEIAHYTRAARSVGVRAAPDGRRVEVENRADRALAGLTLTLPRRLAAVRVDGQPWTDVRGDQVRLPVLEPGARLTVLIEPA